MQSEFLTPQPWLPSEAGGQERIFAPSTQRNRDAIASILGGLLPRDGLILELASGSGEHVIHFASLFPQLTWQPSDTDAHALASIEAWRQHSGLANVRTPLSLDVAAPVWPIRSAEAVLCVNMVHISPWSSTEGLMRGCRQLLTRGQPLFLYGPFLQPGLETAPSNVAFDASLRERNAEWGLRAIEDVIALARRNGFSREQVISMPANNLFIALYI